MKGMGGYCPGTLKSARSIDSQELEVVANMGMSGSAGGAISARMEGAYHYPFSQRPALDVRADLGNLTRHFMANDLGDGHALIHTALEYMQVGAADPTIGHIDADFV
jgi:hypothetical protein